jgi:ABC-type nitrate/sulfonate/bicarbonate transport system ATPase subunit
MTNETSPLASLGADAASPPLLHLDGIRQEFPAGDGKVNVVLKNITFRVDRPGTVCILGPSGCGKSTILRMVSGMYDRRVRMPTGGQARICGRVVTAPHDEVLTVFQKPILKAWLTVRGNVLLPFRAGIWREGVSESERTERVDRILEAVGLSAAAKLYPRQLSGGMLQRVSLAARLVLRPSVLCLDEPFSALDPQTRREMQDLVLGIWRESPCLALFVTHDITEALRVADRIIVLSTRPASIVADISLAAPKPRADSWFRSPECLEIEQRILGLIRNATGQARGTLTVDV